jgi:hypothetical protein
MLQIPTFARIAWNTFDRKDLWRDDQESIFLATFDDFQTKTLYKHQIDYSYYNRGRFESAPKFVLHVYSFGQDFENYSDTVNYFDKEYDTMDEAADDLNQGFNPQFKTWVEAEFKTTVPTTNLLFKREGTPFND